MDIKLTINKDDNKVNLLKNTILVGRVGDDRNRTMKVTVLGEDGLALSFTGKTIQFEGINGQGKRVITKLGITNVTSGGRFDFTPTSPFYTNSGYFRLAYFRIIDTATNVSVSTNDFEVRILSNAMYSEENAMDYVDGMQAMIQGIVQATNDELTAQMQGIKNDIALSNTQISTINTKIGTINAQIVSLNGDIDALDQELVQLGGHITSESNRFTAMINTKTGDLDAKITLLNAKLDRIESEIGDIDFLNMTQLLAVIDPIENGYRMFSKGNKNVARMSTPYDLGKLESLDWTYIDTPLDSSLPPDIKGIAGWVQKVLTNTSMGVIFITNHTSRRVYFGNAYGGTPLVWNRNMGFDEFNNRISGTPLAEGNNSVTYAGKVTGSNIVNPHRAENLSSPSIVIPFNTYLEFTQPSYDLIKVDDAREYVNATSVVGNTVQIPFSFNLKEQIARDYPITKDLLWSQVIKMLSSVKFEAWMCGAGAAGNMAVLSRVQNGNSSTPTYLDDKSTTATSPTWLETIGNTPSVIESMSNSNGIFPFLIRSQAASATVTSSIRIRFVRLSYTINLTSVMDTIFNKLNDPENRYRTSLPTGVIPQNPTWVSKNLQDNAQLDHDWIYSNTLMNVPTGESNSGYLKRSRVGDNIQTVWYRAYNSTTIYKSSKLNTNEWTYWIPDDGNGWIPQTSATSITTLPTRSTQKQYATLSGAASPTGTPIVGVFEVSGIATRLAATFESMDGEVWHNALAGTPPSWGVWQSMTNITPIKLLQGHNINNIKPYPPRKMIYITPTSGIALSIVGKPSGLTDENFQLELIPIRDNGVTDYAYIQRITGTRNLINNIMPKTYERQVATSSTVGMANFVSEWQDVSGGGGGGTATYPYTIEVTGSAASGGVNYATRARVTFISKEVMNISGRINYDKKIVLSTGTNLELLLIPAQTGISLNVDSLYYGNPTEVAKFSDTDYKPIMGQVLLVGGTSGTSPTPMAVSLRLGQDILNTAVANSTMSFSITVPYTGGK